MTAALPRIDSPEIAGPDTAPLHRARLASAGENAMERAVVSVAQLDRAQVS